MAELEDDSVDFSLDLEAATRREDVVNLLRKLHIAADEPSRRDLQRWAAKNGKPPLAPATQTELLSGQRWPRREVVLAFVEGCGVRGARLREWQRMLVRVALAEHDRPPFVEEIEEQRRQVLAEAQAQAEAIVRQAQEQLADAQEARQTADEAINTARQQAEKIIADAQQAARDIGAEAKIQLEETNHKLDGLRKFEREYNKRLRAHLEATLRSVQEAELPEGSLATPEPPVIDLARRYRSDLIAYLSQRLHEGTLEEVAPPTPMPSFPRLEDHHLPTVDELLQKIQADSTTHRIQQAHAEGFAVGKLVTADAPVSWLEAVCERRPHMPSDLEARLLQGSKLSIDDLLNDDTRHALRQGFWEALEQALGR